VDVRFPAVYAEHAPAIYRYLKRLTGRADQVEDLLQETFLKLHVYVSGGGTLDNPRAWLFRVAGNLARDRARDAMRAALREQGYEGPSRVVDFPGRVAEQQVITRVLARLTSRMRQVLLLSVEGCTYEEIAAITGIEQAYVGVVLHRARAAFARYYEAENGQQAGRQPTGRSLR
jgi:RNA polymerase sigma-70 factor (ECF subfamily)